MCSCHQAKVLRVFESWPTSVILSQAPAGLDFGTSTSSDFSGLDWPGAILPWVPLNVFGSGKKMMSIGKGDKEGTAHSQRGLPKSPSYENTQKEGTMQISNTVGEFHFPS